MLCTETKTDEDARKRSEGLWTPELTEHADGTVTGSIPGPWKEDGRFWGDAIRDAKDDPAARPAMAKRHLPMPAAFREIAAALRAIIKKQRSVGEPFEAELRELHRWAALQSWSAPYTEMLREPGFNVLESTPYANLARLDLSYNIVSCDELVDLNKTDRKMMREAWGEPAVHTTAHALYGDLWRVQERKLVALRKKRRDDLMDEVLAIARSAPPEPAAPAASPPPSAPRQRMLRLFSRIFGR